MAEPNPNLLRHHNAYKVSVSSLKGKNKRWQGDPKVARELACAHPCPSVRSVVNDQDVNMRGVSSIR